MRKYCVKYGDFANDYSLAYAENEKEFEDLLNNRFEKITRKEAINLAIDERERRKLNETFSGSASNYIYPAGFYLDDDFPIHMVTYKGYFANVSCETLLA